MKSSMLSLLVFIACTVWVQAQQTRALVAWDSQTPEIGLGMQELASGNLLFFSYNSLGVHALKTTADLRVLDHHFTLLPYTDLFSAEPLLKGDGIYLTGVCNGGPQGAVVNRPSVIRFDTNGVFMKEVQLAGMEINANSPRLIDLDPDHIAAAGIDMIRGGVDIVKIPTDFNAINNTSLSVRNYKTAELTHMTRLAFGHNGSGLPVLGVVQRNDDSVFIALQRLDANMDPVDALLWKTDLDATSYPSLYVLDLPDGSVMAAYAHAGFSVTPQGGTAAFGILPDSNVIQGIGKKGGKFFVNYTRFFEPGGRIALWEQPDSTVHLYKNGNILNSRFGGHAIYGSSKISPVPAGEMEVFGWDDIAACHDPVGSHVMRPLGYDVQPFTWSLEEFTVQASTADGESGMLEFPPVSYGCSPFNLTLDEPARPDMDIYPNPAVSQVYIQSELPVTQVEIMDISGKAMQRKRLEGNTVSVDGLSPGLYIFRLYTKQGTVTKKIMVAKE